MIRENFLGNNIFIAFQIFIALQKILSDDCVLVYKNKMS